MPSFDIVSQIEIQEVDNAVNNVLKEVATRFDFRGSATQLTLNRKEKCIELVAGDEMKVKALREMLVGHFTRRKLDPRAMDFGEPEATSKGQLRQRIRLREGVDTDTARRIVKLVKDSRLKVQTLIQDQQVRVAGKQLDDLQAVIRLVKEAKFDLPFQFVNMKK
jgi:uncharacterized protein YajQ (UPF0234 family)